MPGNNRISFKTARRAAGLTQEQAAEASGVSIESWRAYEYGNRLPPREVMGRICEALDANWLAMEYLNVTRDTLEVLPELHARELPTAVLTLVTKVLAFADHHRDRQLMTIAADGVIDESEQEAFEEIVADLDEIVAAALAVKYPKGAKKERLDGGTSKRSVFRTFVENDCKDIISHRAKNASPNFAGTGVTAP